MPEILEKTISCPYCGEAISILAENSLAEKNYIEDCQICCRPIVLDVCTDDDGIVTIQARTENE